MRQVPYRRSAIVTLLASASFLAAGCGGNDDGGGSRGPRDGAKVEIRDVTKPEADEDLTKELGSDGEALTAAGCTFGSFDEQEPEHVDEGEDLSGEEFPPASGRHYDQWAPFGVYDETIEDGYAVHNLEHGGVVVWLGTKVDDEVSDAITDLPRQEEKWLVAPRRDIEGLYSTAWAKGLSCPPAALEKLGPEATADAIEAWYETVVSTGSDAEKDVPAYAGGMKEPTPERDISAESPF